jgi:hypothetical protein
LLPVKHSLNNAPCPKAPRSNETTLYDFVNRWKREICQY